MKITNTFSYLATAGDELVHVIDQSTKFSKECGGLGFVFFMKTVTKGLGGNLFSITESSQEIRSPKNLFKSNQPLMYNKEDSPDYKAKVGTMKTGQILLILTIISKQWFTHMRKILGGLEMAIKVRKSQLTTPKNQGSYDS